MEWMIHFIWRMRLEILLGFFRYLMKRKFRSKWGTCCFQTQRGRIWRCRCHQFQIYGRDVGCPQAMNRLEKRLAHQGTQCWKCGVLRLHDQRGRVNFASLSSRRLCGQCAGNPQIKREIFVWVREKKPGRSCGNEDCHIVCMNKCVRS